MKPERAPRSVVHKRDGGRACTPTAVGRENHHNRNWTASVRAAAPNPERIRPRCQRRPMRRRSCRRCDGPRSGERSTPLTRVDFRTDAPAWVLHTAPVFAVRGERRRRRLGAVLMVGPAAPGGERQLTAEPVAPVDGQGAGRGSLTRRRALVTQVGECRRRSVAPGFSSGGGAVRSLTRYSGPPHAPTVESHSFRSCDVAGHPGQPEPASGSGCCGFGRGRVVSSSWGVARRGATQRHHGDVDPGP